MPLLKKIPYHLAPAPEDLRPDQSVWQVPFTKEIFKTYSEYLERINLYRRRAWTCKVTGKKNLTYEEALVSEQQANEKLAEFPQKFMAPVLHVVQFSMLTMNDLLAMVVKHLEDTFVQGEELLGKSGSSSCLCKILKVLSSDGGPTYEVGWLNESGKVTRVSIEKKDTLIRKKLPFSKGLLKLFIRESTSQCSPWVIQSKLAKKLGISKEPPEELRDRIKSLEVGSKKATKKRRHDATDNSDATKTSKKANTDDGCIVEKKRRKQPKKEDIVYPIEDLLVEASAADSALTERPVPSTKFLVPLDDVGNLLMVWDFLSRFEKVLCLSTFTLDEFENAIVYKGVPNLITETHISILTLLIKDHGEYYSRIHEKKRKETISLKGWSDYLCDFLELENENMYAEYIEKIKDGNYCMLSAHAKLQILYELLHWAISAEAIRGHLDSCIEQQHDLIAIKKEEDLEEMRKRREEKRLKKTIVGDECLQGPDTLKGINGSISVNMHDHVPNDLLENGKVSQSVKNVNAGSGGGKLEVLASRREVMKKKLEAKVAMEREKEILRLEELERIREENRAKAKEAKEKKLKEQRLESFEREMEKLDVRTNSLGKDRDHNTYWFFRGEGRVFVEYANHSSWGFYSSKEELDAFIGSLNPKGVRELSLQSCLQKVYPKICSAIQRRSKELAHRVGLEDPAILRRSVRVSALPKDKKKVPSFLGYVNKWRK